MKVNDFSRFLIKLLVRAREIQQLEDKRENPQKAILLNREARENFPPELAIYIYENINEISSTLNLFGFTIKEKNESFLIKDLGTGSILCSISTTNQGNFSFFAFPAFES